MKKVISFLLLYVCALGLFFAQEKGYKEEILTQGNYDNRYASYNKAGNKIIFESNRDGHWQIYVMSINGKGQKRLIRSEFNDRRPVWHPFKNMIMFESDRKGYSNIYTYDLDTRQLRILPIPIKGNKSRAQFAPNGQELVFNHKVGDNNFNIYFCSIKGKRLEKIRDNAYANLRPYFSPRGDAFAYYSKKNTDGVNDEIYVYNIILNKESRLTSSSYQNITPSWSNKGFHIAYSSTRDDENGDIYLMTNMGSSPVRVTNNDQLDELPSWSPNDINLLITGNRNGYSQIIKVLLKEPVEDHLRPILLTNDN
ncbi:MAG: TolB family protein [bacterium]